MAGDYQQMTHGWLVEQHTTFSMTLSQSTVWRWQQVAHELSITDNSALAAFLLQHYEATRNSLMQTSFCTSCGTPLDQVCTTCFSLAPKLQPQVSATETALSTSTDPSCEEPSQVACPLSSDTTSQADDRPTSGDTSSITADVADNEAAGGNLDDNSAADYEDDTDDEYYAKEAGTVRSDIKSENEISSGVELGKEENPTPCRESETFTCKICSQIFFDPDQLVIHTQTHSDDMVHECTQCKARFFQLDILKRHQDTHSQQKKHPCELCSASFSRADRLSKHLAHVHKTKRKRKGKVLSSSTSKTWLPQDDVENSEMKKSEMWQRIQEKGTGNRGSKSDRRNSKQQGAPLVTEEKEAGSDETNFMCRQCGKEFFQKHHLERHVLTHTGEKRYGCQQCGAAFVQLNSLVVHMHSHYSHKPFLCGQCHKSFTTLSYMTKHKCKSSRKQQQCPFCGETFRTYNQLTLHSCPQQKAARTIESECEEVSGQYFDNERDSQALSEGRKTRSVTSSEMRSKRPRGRPRKNGPNGAEGKGKSSRLKAAVEPLLSSTDTQTREETHPHCCKFCGARFMFLNHLTRHLQDHTGENAFKCSQCSESFRSMARLTNHLRTHSAARLFPCEYCSKTLKSLYTLKEHLRSHTGEKPFKCDVCGSCFTLSSTYKAHLRTHTGERPYLCPHCGKSFVRSSNLSVHIRACTGDKPYTCTECGKSFSDVGYYKKHVNNHAGIRPYKCEYCGKAFSQSTSLKLHIRIHTGEKPYKCSECHMAFAIPNSLTEHMRKHTGVKPYKCSVCGKGFAKSCNRLAHFRTHNKNNLAPVPQPISGLTDTVPILSSLLTMGPV